MHCSHGQCCHLAGDDVTIGNMTTDAPCVVLYGYEADSNSFRGDDVTQDMSRARGVTANQRQLCFSVYTDR